MTAAALVDQLRSDGFAVWVDAGQVRLRAPEGTVPAAVVAQVRSLKPQILALLSRPANLADTAAAPMPINQPEAGVPAAPEAPGVLADQQEPGGVVAVTRAARATPSRRHAYLRAWLRSAYLGEGEGTAGFADLFSAERSECRERASAWIAGADDGTGTEELAAWIGCSIAQLNALRAILRGRPEAPDLSPDAEPLPVRMARWSPEVQILVDWFTEWEGTDEPFSLGPGIRVTGPRQFIANLHGDVAAGVKGPRALYGALQADLSRLYERFGPEPIAEELGSNAAQQTAINGVDSLV